MAPLDNVAPSRRLLLKGAAAGAVLFGFHLPPKQALGQGAPSAQVPEVNAWVVIHPDDRVVLRMARSEMGQGTRTGLAQMIAEELHCDWSKISTEYVTPGQSLARNRAWGAFLTAGSQGIRNSQDYVRKGGAAARIMLVAAAATRWGVPAAECTAKDSVITHGPTGRTLRYGEVAADAARLT
ncbi:MAG: aldehyde dehydrogenase, partial [Rhizobiales bacterium 32-66-8]